MAVEHLPVMAAEVVEFLVTRTDGVFVDATVGPGGHAYAILNNAPAGRLVGIDLDQGAIEEAKRTLMPFGERVCIVQGNFAHLRGLAASCGVSEADGVLFDLGFSSAQLDDPKRGLSFTSEGPLDMRFDRTSGETARSIVSKLSERDLARLILEFGEERRAHPIARAILGARDKGELESTADLARAILSTKPRKRTKTLARVFQALRIAVNKELENLSRGLTEAVDLLRPGGRLVAIAYHSLEDRLVKRYFVSCERPCTCPPDVPKCVCGKEPTMRIVTRRVVRPTPPELARNPRARSAKLRVAEKLAPGERP